MSLFRSLFQSPPSRYDEDYELPPYSMPSPRIPPPVTASVYSSPRAVLNRAPPSPLGRKQRVPDTLASLQQREQQLQEHLQDLLDAQGEGLLAGLGGASDDATSTGSSTPRGYSIRDRSLSPPGTPVKRKVGLRAARRGIWKTIRDLAVIKAEEETLIDADVTLAEQILVQVARWEQKEEGLAKRIDAITGGVKVDELQAKASQLAKEIEDTETRLAQMKTRQKRLLSEIADIENSVQAKLSSYKESLRLVKSDVQQFLERPSPSTNPSVSGEATFYGLPEKRRTLDMAKEHWQSEHETLSERKKTTDTERAALEDGAVVWKEVVAEVTEFEKILREQTSQMSSTANVRRNSAQSDIVSLLANMDQRIESLNAKYEVAESRGWNLLVCCIGAELEAFKQGREILQEALDSSKGSRSTGSAQELMDLPSHSSPQRKPRTNKELVEFDADDEAGRTEDELLTQKTGSPSRSSAHIQDEAGSELLTRKTRLPLLGSARLSASGQLRGSGQLNRGKAPTRSFVNHTDGEDRRGVVSPRGIGSPKSIGSPRGVGSPSRDIGSPERIS